MDDQPGQNPVIALAVLALGDHWFYADGKSPTVHPFKPIPHEDTCVPVPSLPMIDIENLDQDRAPVQRIRRERKRADSLA